MTLLPTLTGYMCGDVPMAYMVTYVMHDDDKVPQATLPMQQPNDRLGQGVNSSTSTEVSKCHQPCQKTQPH